MNSQAGPYFETDVFASLGRDLASTSDAETAARIIPGCRRRAHRVGCVLLDPVRPGAGGSPRPLYTVDTINGERVVQGEPRLRNPAKTC
ncbi:MAG: hypothetical protein HND47_14425 [Chloroflexi bacterium]|nr:hypothetical protein [Chloroflexota bacterium]